MFDGSILTLITFLPLLGAMLIFLFVKGDNEVAKKIAKIFAIFVSLINFFISIWLVLCFDKEKLGFQFKENIVWFDNYNINYALGIDGISLAFIILTTILVPICILASYQTIKNRVKEYMILFLILETSIIGLFSALDMMLFFVFFEAMLIPMFLLIGIWGGERRIYASIKFFLYTLAGSVFLLLAIIYIYINTETMNIEELARLVPKFEPIVQNYLWIAFFAAFAIKVPMWPVHTWLPDAHVESPTAGSVVLAGILLKVGAYGFLRFSLPMLPGASEFFAPFMFVLSVIAIIYASLVALAQDDMKKLIAYSSIAHMGFVTIGIFSFNLQSIEGALFQMVSHGVVSAALFLCVGVLYDRMHTREISKYGGVATVMPKYALVMMFFTMAAIGVPGTSGFVGEFLVIAGTFQVSKIFAALTATGVILGAVYMLYLYKRVMFGEIVNEEVRSLKDLSKREILIFFPLVLLTIMLGIYPSVITDIFHIPVDNLITHMATK